MATVAAIGHQSSALAGPSHAVSVVAANPAALAWPDGNDDVDGVRTSKRSSPSTVGR